MTRRRPDPYANGRGPVPLSIEVKLMRRSARDEFTGCLLWTGGVDKDGYGKVWHQGKSLRVHRAQWLIDHGSLPVDPVHILHTCDVPACHEATHLYEGTQQNNMDDRVARGRWKGGRPKGGMK